MSMHRVLLLLLVLAAAAPAAPAGAETGGSPPAAHPAGHPADYGARLGTVELPATCAEAANPLLEQGLALLHHMTYEGAREAFAAATAADPECGVGYWGQAMTFIHPLWSDPPTEALFERGRELLATAQSRGPHSDRLKAYVSAAEAYYASGRGPTETANLAAFEKGWERVHRQYPDDPEAACFYALARLGTADPRDKTYASQRAAAEIVEQVLARVPDHPGGHHYLIHASDYPPLAAQALEVARSYGRIAPAVPHALHMPTHIFTRLGLWSEAIDWNRNSAAAALHHPVDGAVSMHHLHALDYQAYAHLQRGEDAAAEAVAAGMRALKGPFQAEVATPYTFAALPARLVLERQRWAEAAALEPRVPAALPWEKFPAVEAITHFARALGAARSGDPEGARQAIARLAELRDAAAVSSAYWAHQVDVQRVAAEAWLLKAEGRAEEALATLSRAAEMEASTEKHPVTPGEVLPVRELLADLLFEMGRFAEAQAAYEATLERSPGRLNSLYGAGRAAEAAGDGATAARYYRLLLDGTAVDSGLERLAHARRFLDNATVATVTQ